ncbi:MAG: hypothetical protein VYE31_02805 [Pseudomonadota bacterium]|nr:hypothetical protein [Pseudomonadota bacterium]
MLFNIIFIILLLTIIYGYLIYLIIKVTDFKSKIILVLSIIVLFIGIYSQIFSNLGYPTTDNLPPKFKIISMYKLEDRKNFIVLAQDLENNSLPRLYLLNYSKKLDNILSQAFGDIQKGYNIIGEITDDYSQNYYGIKFKKIEKRLPLK